LGGVPEIVIPEQLVDHACYQGYRLCYLLSRRLFEQLTISYGYGSYLKLLALIAKMDVLIIDDCGLELLTQSHRNDLLEIMVNRSNSKSALFTSQLLLTQWHDFIADPAVAGAILDRLLHSGYKLRLKG